MSLQTVKKRKIIRYFEVGLSRKELNSADPANGGDLAEDPFNNYSSRGVNHFAESRRPCLALAELSGLLEREGLHRAAGSRGPARLMSLLPTTTGRLDDRLSRDRLSGGGGTKMGKKYGLFPAKRP